MFKNAIGAMPALIAAAAIAGALTVLPGASQSVSANSPLNNGKSDRLDARAEAPKCSEQTWPYYDVNCVKGPAAASGRSVRIVTTDRVTASVER
jgi:hypothetical protein